MRKMTAVMLAAALIVVGFAAIVYMGQTVSMESNIVNNGTLEFNGRYVLTTPVVLNTPVNGTIETNSISVYKDTVMWVTMGSGAYMLCKYDLSTHKFSVIKATSHVITNVVNTDDFYAYTDNSYAYYHSYANDTDIKIGKQSCCFSLDAKGHYIAYFEQPAPYVKWSNITVYDTTNATPYICKVSESSNTLRWRLPLQLNTNMTNFAFTEWNTSAHTWNGMIGDIATQTYRKIGLGVDFIGSLNGKKLFYSNISVGGLPQLAQVRDITDNSSLWVASANYSSYYTYSGADIMGMAVAYNHTYVPKILLMDFRTQGSATELSTYDRVSVKSICKLGNGSYEIAYQDSYNVYFRYLVPFTQAVEDGLVTVQHFTGTRGSQLANQLGSAASPVPNWAWLLLVLLLLVVTYVAYKHYKSKEVRYRER